MTRRGKGLSVFMLTVLLLSVPIPASALFGIGCDIECMMMLFGIARTDLWVDLLEYAIRKNQFFNVLPKVYSAPDVSSVFAVQTMDFSLEDRKTGKDVENDLRTFSGTFTPRMLTQNGLALDTEGNEGSGHIKAFKAYVQKNKDSNETLALFDEFGFPVSVLPGATGQGFTGLTSGTDGRQETLNLRLQNYGNEAKADALAGIMSQMMHVPTKRDQEKRIDMAQDLGGEMSLPDYNNITSDGMAWKIYYDNKKQLAVQASLRNILMLQISELLKRKAILTAHLGITGTNNYVNNVNGSTKRIVLAYENYLNEMIR